jgi:hypothetical protein
MVRKYYPYNLHCILFGFAGDIVYFEIPGRPILVLNSFKDAEDLLVKRAAIWSDRPHNYMVDIMFVIVLCPGSCASHTRAKQDAIRMECRYD